MSTNPTDLLDRARGDSLTQVAKRGIGAWLLAVSTAVITGTQQIVDLLIVTPVQVMTDVIQTSGQSVFIDPLSVISSGADSTSGAIDAFGFLALPIAVIIVLGSMLLVTEYLQREGTSDLFPGGVSDYIPFIGADEEEEA